MREHRGSISKAKSYKEIGEFWDAHNLTEFWGQTKKASFGVDIESEVEPHGLKPMPAYRSALRHAGVAPPHALSGLPSSRMAGFRAGRRNPPKHTPTMLLRSFEGYAPHIHRLTP